jgi:molybdate-binding protein
LRHFFHALEAAAKMTRADLHLVEPVERSQTDPAMALADERADVGLGIETVARQFKLDFVPLIEERCDLLVWRKAWFDAPCQKLAALCRTEKFAARARAVGGYDNGNFSAVHFNGAR